MQKKKINRRAKGEGSIFKRNDGKWVSKICTGYNEDGRIKYKYVYGKTQSEVKEKTDKIKSEVTMHTYIDPTKILVGNWSKNWLEVIIKNSIKDTTYLLYEYVIRKHIIPEIGGIKLIALKTADIQKLYNTKAETLSAQTVHHIHNVLRQILDQAISEKLINTNPCNAAKLPKMKKKEMKTLNKEQIKYLLNFIKNSKYYNRLYALYYLDLSTGMRRGELLGLRWKDIDLKKELIRVSQQLVKVGSAHNIRELKTESSQNRTIAINHSIVSIIKEHQHQQKELLKLIGYNELKIKNQLTNGLVFVTLNTDNTDITYIQPKNLCRSFKSLLKSANLPDIRFHDLRHSFALLSLEAGVDIKTLQSDMGHETISTTLDSYGHVNIEMKKDAAKKREDFIN